MYIAFKSAGLVFDGRLVIKSSYETNDKFIYAAGPITKYKRIFYADRYRHEYYKSEEIGRRLAKKIVKKLDPLQPFTNTISSSSDPNTVHIYKDPLTTYCKLIGNFYYLYIREPGKPLNRNEAEEYLKSVSVKTDTEFYFNKYIL